MFVPGARKWLLAGLLSWLALAAVLAPVPAHAEEELTRKVKTRVPPVYPEIARRMGIAGTVRIIVVVAPSGAVKSTKVLGGHPLLANSAVDAVKRWKFEPASDESSGVVEIKFQPQE